jgi:hypothetical protein
MRAATSRQCCADIFSAGERWSECFWLERQAERGFADAKFGALAEHGGADAFFFEEGAVGGVEVAEVDVVIADFDDAVVSRDFGILEGDVGAIAANDDARFLERVRGTYAGPGDDCEDNGFCSRQDGSGVRYNERRLCTSAVATGEGRERRDGDGGIGMFASVNDGGRGAAGAAKFYFGVCADVGVFEDVLRAAVTACRLHGMKIARAVVRDWRDVKWVAEKVIGQERRSKKQ